MKSGNIVIASVVGAVIGTLVGLQITSTLFALMLGPIFGGLIGYLVCDPSQAWEKISKQLQKEKKCIPTSRLGYAYALRATVIGTWVGTPLSFTFPLLVWIYTNETAPGSGEGLLRVMGFMIVLFATIYAMVVSGIRAYDFFEGKNLENYARYQDLLDNEISLMHRKLLICNPVVAAFYWIPKWVFMAGVKTPRYLAQTAYELHTDSKTCAALGAFSGAMVGIYLGKILHLACGYPMTAAILVAVAAGLYAGRFLNCAGSRSMARSV